MPKYRYVLRYLKVSVPALMVLALLLNCEKSGTASDKSDAAITIPINNAVKPPVGGIRIAWDYTTLKKVSPSNTGIRYAGYSRLIQLHDGSLVCIFEADGHVAVVKSNDLGNTWSKQINVADPDNGINMSVPDILELADHSLLACYNPRPVIIDPSRHFAIKTKKSYDGGLTWKDERTLYQADYKFENGCWEPSAIQLPTGEIQLYFANEGIYTNTNEQNISMVRSSDGGLTWSATPQIVSFRPGKRDGMPCPLLLKNGNDIVFSIEDNGFTNFKPYIIRSSIKNNWQTTVDANSTDRNYALADKVNDNIYAGAPYLRQLTTGETILSYQGTEDRTSNDMDFAEMKVVIGDNSALNFNRKTVPFNISPNKSGLWNSVSVLNDNTVVALTSTSNYATDKASEIWMIKGHVIPQLSAEKQTMIIDGLTDEPAWKTAFPIFVGHTSPTQAIANLTYDDNALYVMAKIADSKVVTGQAVIENNDGITVYVDAANKSTEKPDQGIFKVCLSADNRLAVYQGYNSAWNAVGNLTIQHAVKIAGGGYLAEIAIPWMVLDSKPPLNSRIGFNMSLTENTGKTTADYTESISANQPDQPFSWCTLMLK